MRRYWVSGVKHTDLTIHLAGDDYHHICGVCRQDVGSKFEVLTEDGWALFVEIEHIGKKEALAKLVDKRKIEPLAKPHIHLALSVPKINTLEKVLEKSVELGVHSVWPFYSDYSFVKSKKKLVESKFERMERIIKGATQQTGRGELMALQAPRALPDLLSQYKNSPSKHGVFAYEGGQGSGLRENLSQKPQDLENLWLFVGSEGGFSDAEVAVFNGINLFPVSLGHQVLRVETACVTLVSVIKYELGLL